MVDSTINFLLYFITNLSIYLFCYLIERFYAGEFHGIWRKNKDQRQGEKMEDAVIVQAKDDDLDH